MKKTIKKIPKFFPVFLLFLLASVTGLAQNAISGKVTDANGAAVQGVTVTVKGTKISTQTSADGSFKLSTPTPNPSLVFTSVGFLAQEATGSLESAVSISLTRKNQELDEVVIVGYGTAKKKDLTGAVTVVNSKDFVKGSITTPEQLISGKVAGVSIISNGGAPGSGSTIRIRGGASLNASNDPLIVIDGVPLDNGGISGSANALALINPNDIETFNILKDASAAAIYGSRASNGVIIITTKRGTSGKAKVNFNTQFSVGTITKKVDNLSADEFKAYVRKNGTTDQQNLMGLAKTDWQDEIYQNSFGSDNNISVSGTKNKVPYRFSAGYLNQTGMLRTDKLERITAGLNLSPKYLNNNLKVDLNIKASQTLSKFANQGAIGAAVFYDPTQAVRSNSKRFNGYYEWLDPASQTGLRALAPRNPVALLEEDDNRGDVKRSIGNIIFEYKLPFFPAIRANLNLGYDIAKGYGSNYINDSAASNYQRFKDAGGILHGGTYSQFLQNRNNKLMEFYLGYSKDFTAIKSKVDLIAGYSYNDFSIKNTFFDNRTADRTVAQVNAGFDKPANTIISTYARLNYSLMNRYLITATVRRDGSSRFSEANRYGTFPSVAFAWRIKEESFLRNSKTFSDLKLRLGYGETGQQDGIGLYDYTSFYFLSGNGSQYQLGNTFYYLNRPAAYYPNRKWEQTATSNIGLDFGLFDNRISGTAEVYLKKTTDLLNEIDQPALSNFGNKIIANVGSMENKGAEFTISADLIRKKDVNWTVSFNATYNENKITKLDISNDPNYKNEFGGISGGTGTTLFVNQTGYARGSFYVYKQVYDAAGKPIDGLFEDLNRDGVIDSKDRYLYKSAAPESFLGFSTSLNVKKWNAGFVMRANLGNYVYNNINSNAGTNSTIFGNGYLNNGYSDLLNTNFSGTKKAYILSDYYIQNASFLRMDNFNLGYNAGPICHGKTNLRINFNVQNVFVITKYDGLDPEISGGVDNNFYPRPRTYVLGFNLDF